MRGFEDDMFFCVDERFLFLCMASPEQEYQEVSLVRKCLNNRVCKIFPSFPGMRHRLSRTDGERRIEEEDALLCPASEIATFWTWDTEISLNLLEDIHQRWRVSDSFHD